MQKKSIAKAKLLQEVIDEIESRCLGDTWEIALAPVLELLDSDRADFFRYCYALEDKSHGFALAAVDSFGPHNMSSLLGFLKYRGFGEAEEFFFKAGYHLKAQVCAQWLEFFQSLCQSRLLNHEIDRELLEVALSGCRYFQDAAEFYCYSVFSMDELMEWASGLYLEKYLVADHPCSRKILKDYIYLQFASKKLLERMLLDPFISRLEDKCRQWQIFPESRQKSSRGKQYKTTRNTKNRKKLSPRIQAALQVLGVMRNEGDSLPSRELLKKKYYSCLKKYHPDIHRKGNEATRKLIESYSIVLSAYDGSA